MYDYTPLPFRPRLTWPNDARLAVVITVNLEAWDLVQEDPRQHYPGGPDVLPLALPRDVEDFPNYTWREYGPRVGLWRIVEVLDRFGIRSSATLGALVCRKYPQVVAELKKRSWEFVAHSYRQQDLLVNLAGDEAAERQLIQRTLQTYQEVVGEKAKGWLSPATACTRNTPRLLAQAGLLYHCDYSNDDQPFLLRGDGWELVAIPYTIEINDYAIFVRRGNTPEEFFLCVKEEFDVLYGEGEEQARIMNLGLHPHVTGRAFRIRALERALQYITQHERVWFARRDEIAEWYLKQIKGG